MQQYAQPANNATGRTASFSLTPDKTQFCREWGWVALRGLLAIAFGFIAMIWPFATIWALAIMWGAFVLTDGLAAGVAGWRLYKRGVRWWPYLAVAVIGIVAGIVAFIWPAFTAIALMYVIAFWALFIGISQIIAAVQLRKEIEGEWFLAFAGAVSVLFGLMLILRPFPEGLLAMAWIAGFYAFVTGCLYLMLAFRLRKRTRA